jgi:hypothetical protein
MHFLSWLGRSGNQGNRKRSKARRERSGRGRSTRLRFEDRRLCLEPLEDRRLLSALGTATVFEGPGAGSASDLVSSDGAWTATANAPWLQTSSSGNGNGQAVFSFDANPGATRTGTLTIAGQTLAVTQAGSGYLAASSVTALVPSESSFDAQGIAVDSAGNVYIANTRTKAIQMWDPATQTITSLVSTPIGGAEGLALDSAGNVYFVDTNSICEWNVANGAVNTLVSSGLSGPEGVAVDSAGNVYIADTGDNAIKVWSATTKTLSTLVSSGLTSPWGVAVDGAGNVYIADTGDNAIKERNVATGTVSTLVSSGISFPDSVAVDDSGNVYIDDFNNDAVKEWNAATRAVSTLCSTGGMIGLATDSAGNVYFTDGDLCEWNAATQTVDTLASSGIGESVYDLALANPEGVAVDSAGSVYVTDSPAYNDGEVKEWDPTTQTLTSLVTGLNFPGPDNIHYVGIPAGVAVDGSGNLYIADYGDGSIDEWSPTAQTLSTLVSSGYGPEGVALDSAGDVYIADTPANTIEEWNAATQTLSTIVGGLSSPVGVAVDGAGNVYIADFGDAATSPNPTGNAILEWNVATQALTTVGQLGQSIRPSGVAADGAGNVYISTFNGPIMEWNAATQTVDTVAPMASVDFSGPSQPSGVAVDAAGNVYFSDYNGAIKEVPREFVPAGPISEGASAGSDALPPVLGNALPPGDSIVAASDQSWLTIDGVSGGVVQFSFSRNVGAARIAHITLLGQQITVTQTGPFADTSSATIGTAVPVTYTTTVTSNVSSLLQATFSDTDPSPNLSASVDWGDGTGISPATVTQTSSPGVYPATYAVTFQAHAYATAGEYTPVVTVADGDEVDSDGSPGSIEITDTTFNVIQIPVSVVLTASPTVSSFEQLVTFTATVTPSTSTGDTLTGSVDFFDSTANVDLGEAAVDASGVARLTTTALAFVDWQSIFFNRSGAATITASYSGDTDFAPVSSSSVVDVLDLTTTSLRATSSAVVGGEPLSLTATVSVEEFVVAGDINQDITAGVTPVGTVDFVALNSTTGATADLGTVPLGPDPSDTNATATLTNVTLPAGMYAVTATYSGDTADYLGGSSAVLGVGPTNVAITASQTVAGWYQPVTFTATVTDGTGGDTTPTGSVDFFDTATQTDLGQAALVAATDSNGSPIPGTAVATLTINGLGPVIGQTAALSVEANYSGDANFGANNGPSASVALINSTTTALTATPTVALSDQPVTSMAIVSVDVPGGGTPDGTVDFSALNTATNQTTDLGSVALMPDSNDPNATATLPSFTLPSGTYEVTAKYSGDTAGGFAGSSAVLGLAATITTVAGNGVSTNSGDLGAAQSASLAIPADNGSSGIAFNAAGDLFICASDELREVNLSDSPITLPDGSTLEPGQIGTVATALPTATSGSGPFLRPRFGPDYFGSVAVDSLGNVYVADTPAGIVRVINLTGQPETLDGTTPLPVGGIAVVAGVDPANGRPSDSPVLPGDGQPATEANLNVPWALAVDSQGDLFIADLGSHPDLTSNRGPAVFEVADPFGTSAVTLADGNKVQPGEIGTVVDAYATTLAVDGQGDLYYFNSSAGLLSELNLASGQVSAVPIAAPAAYAANGLAGIGAATGLAVDSAGNVYYADGGNDTVLEYSPASGTTSIVAGVPGQAGYYPGDNQQAATSLLSAPAGLAVAPNATLYVADSGNARIRAIEAPSPLQVLAATETSGVTAATLDAVAATTSTFTLQAGNDCDAANLISAVDGMTALQVNGATVPVTVTMDLAADSTYGSQTLSPQPGVTLVIDANGSTLDPDSPALTVTSGNVVYEGGDTMSSQSGNIIYGTSSLTESGDAPTVLVTGGTLTMYNVTIQSSTGAAEPAVEVTGDGSIDLASDATGGDTININGSGLFFDSASSSPNPVTTSGVTYEVNGQQVPVLSSTAADLTPPVAVSGAAFGPLTVLHFTDANPYVLPADFTATVNTGDATLSTAADPVTVKVVADPSGGYDVELSYTYAQPVSGATFDVSVTDGSGGTTSEIASSFTVVSSTVTVTTVCDALHDAAASVPGYPNGYVSNLFELQSAAAAGEPVTLRDAVTAIDNTPGVGIPLRIAFDVQGTGAQVIDVSSELGQLPAVTVPTVIDGYSQSGAAPNTNGISQADNAVIEIEINGSQFPYGTTATGLTIDAGHCVVQGLAIDGFNWGTAIQIGADSGDVGNVIAGDFIGTDASGETQVSNAYGIQPGAYTLIGSSAQLSAVDAAGNTVGIDDSTIASDINTEVGEALGPYLSSGTLYAAEQNVISGDYSQLSGGDGIGGGGTHDVIAGNFIGPDATGTTAIGSGIGINAGQYQLIGGTAPGTENVISGNGGGIPVLADSDFYTIDVDLGSHDDLVGNLIGTANNGQAIAPPSSAGGNPAITGAADIGVLVENSQTADTIADNTIDGHALSGISMAYGTQTNMVVDGNTIAENGYVGIGIISNTADNQFVGNTIAGNGAYQGFSGGPGIAVVSDGIYTASGNSFLQNSIYGNSGPGIDLGGYFYFNANGSPNFTPGAVPPSYSVSGPWANDFQSAPTITSAVTDGTYTEVTGTFQATANNSIEPGEDFRLDFYDNGQTQTWLGSITVQTNSNGVACFTADFAAVSAGDTITATATDVATGDTSDFSGGVTVSATSTTITVSPAVTTTSLSASSTVALSGQPVTFTATVTASVGAPDGPVTFYDDGTTLGTASVGVNGTAVLSTGVINATGSATPQDITAEYNGDNVNFLSSTSGALEVQVVPDTSVTSSNINADLQTAVETAATDQSAAASQPATVTLQASTDDDASGLITALNSIPEPSVNGTLTPVTVTLNLSGTTTYTDQTLSLQPGVTLVIQVNGGTFDPDIPAFTVTSGNVIVEDATFTESGAAPTILVTGGSLTLIDDTIESSTGHGEPAIEIDGGTIDLGTAGSPGGNTLVVSGTGEFIENDTTGNVSAVGDTFVQGTPVITWGAPANITYGTALSATQLDASANVPSGTFTYSPALGTVLGAGANQTLSATFTPTDTIDYKTVTKCVTLTVSQATPTNLAVSQVALTYGTALANSQLSGSVSWTVGGSQVSVPGTFTYTSSAGTVLAASGAAYTENVTFTPNDVTDYTSASTTVPVTVNKATPTSVTVTPVTLTYGTALANSQLSGTATWTVNGSLVSVPGTFTYTTAAGTVLAASGTAYTENVTFTPSNGTDYTTASTTVPVTVNKATQVITWATPASIVYGTALSSTQLDATANVPGTFLYAPAAGTVLAAGTQTLSVTFTPTNSTDYTTATDSVTIVVTQSTTITPGSIYVLDPTAGGALSLSGNAGISIPGALVVDSSSKTALTASGNAQIKAGSIQVVGGVSKSGNATLSPAATTGVKAVPDPLAGLAAPTVASGTPYTGTPISESLSGNSTGSINPGLYSQITVSGNASLKLASGTYVVQGSGFTLSGNASVSCPGVTFIIEGGGFSVSGNAAISGAGVTIFNAGNLYNATSGVDGGTFGSITLSGNASLSAPSSGPYAGILIFQARDNPKALSFSGNAVQGITGTIYALEAQLAESGNAQIGSTSNPVSIVVDTMTLSGNAIAQLTAASGGTAYTPAEIRTAYGINDLALDGTGQTIAIVDAYDDPAIYQALDAFDGQFGLTTSGPTLYQQYGPAASFLAVLNQAGQPTSLPGTDPVGPGNDNWEVEESLDVEWAHAIAPGAKIILVEANGQSLADLMAAAATAAAQPGVSTVSMSWGFAEGQGVSAAQEAVYDQTFAVPGVTFVASTGDYGAADPVYPAFSPNVLAVGGTSLSLNADNSYNGESGWGYYSTSAGAFIGSGGGISQYESEPAYQAGVQATGSRSTPDVSFVADPATGVWIADPYNLDPSDPWEVVGGTSLSAPAWAGLVALVNQGRSAAGQTALNSTSPTQTQQSLYSLSQNDFHTVTSGSNGYAAAAGYNLVTGLGTPVANLVVPDMIAGNFPATGQVAPASAAALVDSLPAGGSSGSTASVMNVFDALPMGGPGSSFVCKPATPVASQATTAHGATVARSAAVFAIAVQPAPGNANDGTSANKTRDLLFAQYGVGPADNSLSAQRPVVGQQAGGGTDVVGQIGDKRTALVDSMVGSGVAAPTRATVRVALDAVIARK